MLDLPDAGVRYTRFSAAYARQRAREGRGAGGNAELLALPYLRFGPAAAQWRVRSRTYDRFLGAVVVPTATAMHRPLRILDLGAGNGWLCYRLCRLGHHAVALDIRTDAVDGLGAAAGYDPVLPRRFPRLAASFDRLPLHSRSFDIAVFNASLHYSIELSRTLAGARECVRAGGRIAILDSPFYRRERDGEAMVAEQRRTARARFGELARDLTAIRFIEYLTADRLRLAAPELHWQRHRVSYPLGYELRPLRARLSGRRPPSRFDLWECTVP